MTRLAPFAPELDADLDSMRHRSVAQALGLAVLEHRRVQARCDREAVDAGSPTERGGAVESEERSTSHLLRG
jgi:hypothetical protein